MFHDYRNFASFSHHVENLMATFIRGKDPKIRNALAEMLLLDLQCCTEKASSDTCMGNVFAFC